MIKRRIPKIKVSPSRAMPNRPIQTNPLSNTQPISRQEAGIKMLENLPPSPINKKTIFSAKQSDRVFILGGGPSIKNINLSFISGEDTICVNKSIDLIKNPTFFITMDYSFFAKTRSSVESITAKAKSSHFIVNKQHDYIKEIRGHYIDTRNNFRYVGLEHFSSVIESNTAVNEKTGFGLSLREFSHGNNSGYCAIQFAILAGYKEIYLIGFDLGSTSDTGETHFHKAYPQVPIEKYRQTLSGYASHLINSLGKISAFSSVSIKTLTPSRLESIIPMAKTIRGINKEILYKPQESKPQVIRYPSRESIQHEGDLTNLVIVAYYTINTPYEEEAKKLISSLNRLGLRYDVVGVKNLGDWQANTRFKAKFMEDMLNKHKGKNLLYVDSDAIIHSRPILFEGYNYDIAVRWQDFRWRKNECLSGTIFMANNERMRELCHRWQNVNISEGPNAKTFEQWNLGSVIKEMESEGKIKTTNLPPEYTFIFDSMKAMYPNVKPVIEHFQASRRLRNKL